MTAVAWAIIFAVLEIGGMADERLPKEQRGGPGFQGFMAICSLGALTMVIACTVKEWH